MSAFKKYLYATAYAALTFVFGYLLFFVTYLGANWLYEALIDWFPAIFHDYSPVLESEGYYTAMLAVNMTAAVLAMLFSALLVTRYDNGRDEYIISKTEGFFRIPEVLPDYYKSYALPDLAAAFICTGALSALIIPSLLWVPERITRFSIFVKDFSTAYVGVFYSEWGYIIAPLFVLVLTFGFKLLSGISGIKRWRAAWLTYN